MEEKLKCGDCGRVFEDGDSLYFKPIPYIKDAMDDSEVTLQPYCKYCIAQFAA